MSRNVLRIMLAVVMLSTFVGALAISSGPARGSSGDGSFTAAETLLSQSGTHGNWAMREPPGFLPVICQYPSGTSGFEHINVQLPLVFPAPGIASQHVRMTLFTNQ